MNKLFLLGLILSMGFVAKAQTPTWADDVAPILYANCTKCHHSGGLAPFSLMADTDAVNNASTILYAVPNRIMPPWPPDPSFRRYAHERLLSQNDINTIVNWVNNGTPIGNLANAPTPPTYVSGSQLGTAPNLTTTIPTYTSAAVSSDDYRCFVIPSNLLSAKNMTALEVLPGNPAIVHHVLVYYDTTGACAALQASSGGVGYPGSGGVGTNAAKLLGGWVPGQGIGYYPTGFGTRIPANADIVIQIHYPTGSNGQTDNTQVNFLLTSNAVRQVYLDPILNHFTDMTDGPLIIPANQIKTFHEAYQMPAINITLLSCLAHMHLIGTTIKSYAVTPAPLYDTIPFINIPDWDFHWQGFYTFRNLLKIPANSWIYAEATYDNTSANPENPNSPPQLVIAGENTTDEMMICYFGYTIYFPGDENIVTDTAALVDLTGNTGFANEHAEISFGINPNPALDYLTINFPTALKNDAIIRVYNLEGKLVLAVPAALQLLSQQINIANLESGIYFVKVGNQTKKFVKN